MVANEYNLMEQCVEDGVSIGWLRAHKHTDTPTPTQIQQQIMDAVMNEICEWFVFNGGKHDNNQ